MKKAKIISHGENHSAINLGQFDSLMEHSYLHPKLHKEIEGKVFAGEILGTTGAEISFQTLPPYEDISFKHQHHNNEEIYIFLKGSGQFQVDNDLFDVSEGSVIRVSPSGKRTYRNTSDKPLIFICIQAKANSLDGYFIEDGFRVI